MVCTLVGCQDGPSGNDSGQGDNSQTETGTKIVKESESETENTEDTNELFSGCAVEENDLNFLVEDMEGYTAWSNKVTLIGERIYFTVLLYSDVKENPSLHSLVSCNLDGSAGNYW